MKVCKELNGHFGNNTVFYELPGTHPYSEYRKFVAWKDWAGVMVANTFCYGGEWHLSHDIIPIILEWIPVLEKIAKSVVK